MKKDVGNKKEYKEICQYVGFGTPISIWALGLGKILSSASIQALGFEKMLSFPFLRL